jgi:hypothetical protein
MDRVYLFALANDKVRRRTEDIPATLGNLFRVVNNQRTAAQEVALEADTRAKKNGLFGVVAAAE